MTTPGPAWPDGERRLIWIEGAAAACRADAHARLAGLDPARVAWLGHHARARAGAIEPGRAARQLGGDLDAAVIDAHDGLDPDDLGALAGMVRGGGALLLLSPPAADWPAHTDPALGRIASHGCPPERFGSAFLERLMRLLAAHPAAIRQNARNGPPPLPAPRWAPTPDARDPDCLTGEQAAAVAAILAVAVTASPAPLLMTADRGRGKSAALGIAARRLTARGQRVTVTAPAFRAAATVFRHAGRRAAAFQAPEAEPPAEGLLLIDEAAALPLPRLRALLAQQPRAVLATTVHGYEGSGHGVALRLGRELQAQYPGARAHHLTAPVRWADGDPLEALVSEALLLDAEPAAEPPEGAAAPALEAVTGAALAAREPDLRAAFGLLVAGHYQTRPRDLRLLLDDPEMRLWLAREHGRVTGVLAARPEGGFAPGLAREIWLGRRRPRGHLLAQSLACHAGVRDAARRRGLRILRVAVHPGRRRHGVGRALLRVAADHARGQGLDWLGASFGATPGLLDFWTAAGLEPVRVGNRRDAASGAHAVMVLSPLSPAGERLFTAARQRLARHFPDQRRHALAGMTSALARRITDRLPPAAPALTDPDDLAAFAHGRRSLLDSHAALAAAAPGWRAGLVPADAALLDAALERPTDPARAAAASGLPGQRTALRRLRALVAERLDGAR